MWSGKANIFQASRKRPGAPRRLHGYIHLKPKYSKDGQHKTSKAELPLLLAAGDPFGPCDLGLAKAFLLSWSLCRFLFVPLLFDGT